MLRAIVEELGSSNVIHIVSRSIVKRLGPSKTPVRRGVPKLSSASGWLGLPLSSSSRSTMGLSYAPGSPALTSAPPALLLAPPSPSDGAQLQPPLVGGRLALPSAIAPVQAGDCLLRAVRRGRGGQPEGRHATAKEAQGSVRHRWPRTAAVVTGQHTSADHTSATVRLLLLVARAERVLQAQAPRNRSCVCTSYNYRGTRIYFFF